MGFSLLLLWVCMKSPCCSAIRIGHSPVSLMSQWVHEFMTSSMQWATATDTYCQTTTLNLTFTLFRVWIISEAFPNLKHLRQYLDFNKTETPTLLNDENLYLLEMFQIFPLYASSVVSSDNGPESQKSLVLVASWFKGDIPMGAQAEGVYSIGLSWNSCFTSN